MPNGENEVEVDVEVGEKEGGDNSSSEEQKDRGLKRKECLAEEGTKKGKIYADLAYVTGPLDGLTPRRRALILEQKKADEENTKRYRPTLRYAKLALSHYGRQQNAKFELVEFLGECGHAGCIDDDYGTWVHINFKAKPKNAYSTDVTPKLFFAELYRRGGKTRRVNNCSVLDLNAPGVAKGCGFCPPHFYHPDDGYIAGHWPYMPPFSL